MIGIHPPGGPWDPLRLLAIILAGLAVMLALALVMG